MPLQVVPAVKTPFVHVAGVHCWSGSVPAAMKPQVPSTPEPFAAAEQAWQVAVQAVLQQTPSAQKPEPQSADSVQGTGAGV
jgi:hypothetical protein